MKNFLTYISRRRFPYKPLITIEISKSRLLHNLKEFKNLKPERSVIPVLKSNAYGHGLVEIATIIEKSGDAKIFAIDSYFEAVSLRSKNIKTPLLIIGYTQPETIKNSRLKNMSFTITSLETLKDLSDATGSISLHLKIDTGMHRQGVLPDELDEAVDLIKMNPHLNLEGIFSHLSDAANIDQNFTKKQIALWNNIVNKCKSTFPNLKYIHLSATDGYTFRDSIIANSARLGIGLYGILDNPNLSKHLDLQPVMEMRTIVTGIKKLKSGDTIGYNNTFVVNKDSRIATIPVGYYEGLHSPLTKDGVVLVGENRTPCPIVGRISMNITTIDVTGVPSINIGSPVIAISRNLNEPNSIVSIARKTGHITYEIAVKIPAHLKRVVV